MTKLKSAPTPQQFATAWTSGFAKAVRDAAGRDGRLSRREAERIAERDDPLTRYADNAVNYLERTGQKSVSVEKLIGKGWGYAAAVAGNVAGPGNRVSLVEARSLPADLRPDFFALRGKEDPGPVGTEALAESAMQTLFDIQMAAGIRISIVRSRDLPTDVSQFSADDAKFIVQDRVGPMRVEEGADGFELVAHVYEIDVTDEQVIAGMRHYVGDDVAIRIER